MTAAERFKAWHDDAANHVLMWAVDWSMRARGVERQCQTCGRSISVWPVVAKKADADPDHFHVICRSTCLPIAIAAIGPLRFGGRLPENQLPEELK